MGNMTVARATRLYRAQSDQPATDALSIQLQQAVQRRWKDVKKRPPAERAKWLRGQEAIAALGAARCYELLNGLDGLKLAISHEVVSEPWLVDRWNDAAKMPPGLVLSQCETRMGVVLESGESVEGHLATPTRRFTPAIAVEIEDYLDDMTAREALKYEYAVSPSALVIRQIEWVRAREEGA